MSIENVLSEIDTEIARLEQVRNLLTDTGARKLAKTSAAKGRGKKRTLSAEGRARIAAAQKKRWAAKKRAA
jgi:hypothetical protein